MYGAVMWMRGPGVLPASISAFRLSSAYGCRLPVVRTVVTPLPRYSLGALKVSCAERPPAAV